MNKEAQNLLGLWYLFGFFVAFAASCYIWDNTKTINGIVRAWLFVWGVYLLAPLIVLATFVLAKTAL